MEGLVHVNNETSGFTSNILLYSIVYRAALHWSLNQNYFEHKKKIFRL